MKIESSERDYITSQDIQNAYLKFYPNMMQYLWDMKAVMNLANLEIAIYQRFPDKEEMLKYANMLERDIQDTYRDDEDLDCVEFKKSFEQLKSYIEDYEDVGYDVYRVPEKIEAPKEEENEPEVKEKKVIEVGKIVKK